MGALVAGGDGTRRRSRNGEGGGLGGVECRGGAGREGRTERTEAVSLPEVLRETVTDLPVHLG